MTGTRLAQEIPWTDHSTGVRTDSALIDGVRYDASIVLAASSSTLDDSWFVEVDLAGAYRRMRSVAGVLDDATEIFQVGQFLIYVDGHRRYEARAARGKPVLVDLDIAGAMTLRLEINRPFPTAASSKWARLTELAWGDPTLY